MHNLLIVGGIWPTWIKLLGDAKYAIWYSSANNYWVFTQKQFIDTLDPPVVFAGVTNPNKPTDYDCPQQNPRDHWVNNAVTSWQSINFKEISFECRGMKIE